MYCWQREPSRTLRCAALAALTSIVLVGKAIAAGGPGVLEIPQPAAQQSGVGIVSGWKCDAGTITVGFDGGDPIEAAYGTPRADTVATCGDGNNAFVLQWNYGLLGDGPHVVRVYDDGVEFASADFNVTTFGVPFLRGATGQYELADFPHAGDALTLEWQQSSQSFQVVAAQPTSTACTTVTTRVNVNYDSIAHPNLSGLAVALGYGESVTMPGTGGDTVVTGRVENLTGLSGGIFQVGDADGASPRSLNAALVSLAQPIPPGDFLAARFDCVSGTAPVAASFPCTATASDNLGLEIPSSELTCTVSLTVS